MTPPTSNTDAVSVISDAASNPTMAKGVASTVTREADTDAMPQDVLLLSKAVEIEHSHSSNSADIEAASQETTVQSKFIVEVCLNILDLRDETKDWLENKYTTSRDIEDFLQLSSKKIEAMQLSTEEIDSDKKGKKHARFNQAERASFILLRRWTERYLDGEDIKWANLNRKSFNELVCDEVDGIIFEEILRELKLSEEAKESLDKSGVKTPASFVMKSKYWFKHEIELSSSEICEIEKFKRWYKYQLDKYLPSDWIVAFREEAAQVQGVDFEWRKVLKTIGLKADAIQALEINDISDFINLIYTPEKGRVTKPKRMNGGVEGISDSDWNEWQKIGLKKNDARHIINFCHWHKFYVAGQKDKSDWAAEFNSAHYERFIQRYIDPSKPDEFRTPGWWNLDSWTWKSDVLRMSEEKQDYFDILQEAVEAGSLTEEQRYHLRQHYKGRREKMELIQEINEGSGSGDNSFQESRLNEIFEEEAARDKNKIKDDLEFTQKHCQFVLSALVAYGLLGIWIYTMWWFSANPLRFEDDYDEVRLAKDTNITAWQERLENASESERKFLSAISGRASISEMYEYYTFVHNVVFGLVTAVVVQELGEEMKETGLYYRFLETYKKRYERSKEYKFRASLKIRRRCSSCRDVFQQISGWWIWLKECCKNGLTRMILWSTRIYIITWIVCGFISLFFGAVLGRNNVLYSTGQTFLGIAATIGYSFFGLSDKNDQNTEEDKDEIGQKTEDADEGAIGGGDGASANNGEEAALLPMTDAVQDAADKEAQPSVIELESHLLVAKAKMNEAVEQGDVGAINQCSKEVIKLTEKMQLAIGLQDNSRSSSSTYSTYL